MLYDIIGDIHGHYHELALLLDKLGYDLNETNLTCRAPKGVKALFVGDFIDRGPHNRSTVDLVRNMCDTGQALAVMGNHEFNAVLWATPHPDKPGKFLRKHSESNDRQHRVFLNEVGENSAWHKEAIAWFKTLPIYLKLDKIHIIHACWHATAYETLQLGGCVSQDGRITPKGWISASSKASPYFAPFEMLLKGPEEDLCEGLSYYDPEGTLRTKARLAWWRENVRTLGEAYASLPADTYFAKAEYDPCSINHESLTLRQCIQTLPQDEKIFIGHIWENGAPRPLSDKVCCVDYSIAKNGKLTAYRVDPQRPELCSEKFVWVEKLRR